MNRNKVLELAGTEAVDLPTGGFFAGTLVSAVEGNPIGVFRSYDFVRCRYADAANAADVNDDGEPDDVNALCRAAGAPNGAVYLADSGFPLEDPTLRVIADPSPNWTGSVRSGLRFGKWNVSGLLDIRRGGQVWNGTKGALYHFGTHKDTEGRATCTFPDDADDYVCTGNPRRFGVDYAPGGMDPGEFKVFGPGVDREVQIGENWFTGVGSGFGIVASQFMEDGSFVKLRELSIGYTFDQPWVQRALGMTSLDIRLAGRNLATWTDYTGVDPETNLAGAEVAARGIDYFNNPQTRSFVITIGLAR
jgi:hypothetical protein